MQKESHTFSGKAAVWDLCLTTENKLWPTVPKHEGNTYLSNTWIFYYPMTRPPLSSPWSTGMLPAPLQSWLSVSQHVPALSTITPLLPGWRQESLKRWQNRSSSADTCWHSAIRILSFSLSLVSESYMGKDALPAWIAICSPQCSRKAASNQKPKQPHLLSCFAKVIQGFRLSILFFFLKEIKRRI